MATLSPIGIELLRNALASVCDEMYIALMKSAYSTNIKERRDHSTAIFDAGGRVVAQGESLPLHLASMLGLVEIVLGKYGPSQIHPGDMFISNDPYAGRGSHLPDVAMVSPVFDGNRPVLFVANIAHHADIGGMAPGSMAGGMTEIYQEGLRIPPIRLVEKGEIKQDIMDIILLNVRVPEERRGDYHAQIAANRLGERRCRRLFERWPVETLEQGMNDIIAASAKRMRSAIRELPDGEYVFTDVIDDDGLGAQDIRLAVRIAITGDKILFDFDGTAPQVTGNINMTSAGLQAAVLYSLKVLVDPDGPQDHGMIEPVTIRAPEGTVVNAAFPGASAARAQTGQRVVDVIFGALAKVLHGKVISASNGANTSASFFGRSAANKFYVYLETLGGGGGARAYKDGADAVQVHMTNTSNLPIEALESEYPLIIDRYELVPDSGGPGKFRGGLGLRRVYRPIDHVMTFSGQGERFVNRPWGLFGGDSGAPGKFELLEDGKAPVRLGNKPSAMKVMPNQAISVTTPGAGGYGPPAERRTDDLKEDATSGKFSPAFLETHYCCDRARDG